MPKKKSPVKKTAPKKATPKKAGGVKKTVAVSFYISAGRRTYLPSPSFITEEEYVHPKEDSGKEIDP